MSIDARKKIAPIHRGAYFPAHALLWSRGAKDERPVPIMPA
jgi:hypothetical protein